MRSKQLIWSLFVVVLLASFAYTAIAGPPDPPPSADKISSDSEVSEVTIETVDSPAGGVTGPRLSVPNGPAYVYESEPNDAFGTANALVGSSAIVHGNIFPAADVDFFSFSGTAGDRVSAATMTSFDGSASGDSTLQLLDTDGVTVLETDLNDGAFNASSSTIAGLTLPSTGTFYVRVSHNVGTGTIRPYALYLRVQSGTPTPEVESNNTPATANPLPVNGWVSGSVDPAADVDFFSFSASAGDTVFLSLDLDPERDAVAWNGRLGIALFGNPPANQILVVNDANAVSPNSEAMFMTIKTAGTYFAYVDMPTGVGGPTQTYHLSVSIYPDEPEGAVCTTYTSTDVPQVIPTGPGMVSSTLTVPGNPRIGDINVSIQLDHTFMQDLDVHLRSPQGNDNGLFTDIGASTVGGTQTQMDITFDDESGIPSAFAVTTAFNLRPELAYRLNWFDGEDAGGTWTLDIRDDATGDGGTLTGWSITICEPPPPPTCPAGTIETVVFSTDFEANDGGFTHSGVQDEWEWGLPTFVPITTCNSGTNCWKTDLDNTYNASSNQDLLSPGINLSGYVGPAWVTWSQRYHIESATFDRANVSVQEVGGANPSLLWQWLGATMNNTVGSPAVTIAESAGWGNYTADISSYVGQNIELKYHLESDTTVQLAGLAIDDVAVMACAPIPEISMEKTVGTDPSVCATTDSVAVAPGADVTYCYEVTNTGTISLTLHDLVDNELGVILDDFSYALVPGASAFLTETVNITATTTNTATWTAFNPGPINIATATDTATVTVIQPEPLVCNGAPVAFEGGIPSDWTVVDNTGGTGIVWGTTADTTCNIANLTNGSGEAACADSDASGSGSPPYDTELVSNAFDLTGNNNVILDVAAYYNDLGAGNDLFRVDVWDGANWTNELSWDEDHMPGDISLDLSTYGGLSGVQVRFTYSGNGWDWYAEVDDVTLTCANVVAPPEIAVAPAALSSTQAFDTVVTQTLTISNLGEADLDWTIDEAPGQDSPAPTFGPIPANPGMVLSSPRTGGSRLPASPLAVLYDQTDNVGTNGFPSQNFETAFDAYDNAGADDFVIPAGDEAWTIESIDVLGSYSTTGPVPTVDVNIYEDAGGLPGTLVYSALGVAPTLDVGGDLSVTLPTPAFLFPGHYWVSVIANMDFGVGGQWFWSTRTVAANNPYVWQNPGDGFATGCTTWSPGASTCGVGGGVEPDALFRLNGTLGLPSVCVTPSDLPWASVSPITGTVPGGSASTVEVTFDSTGYSVGTVLTGTICIASNDPVTPLVTVPITMTVTEIPPSYGVVLSGDQAASGAPNDTITYVVTITNTGNVTDTFDLTAAGAWGGTPSVASVTLGAGESTTFTVDVTIPSGAGNGDSDVTTVTATSQTDASATDSATLTTTAVVDEPEGFEVYLPLIGKQ